MLAVHHVAGTWNNLVTCYIALSDFVKNECVAGGLPEQKIAVKGNFVEDTGVEAEPGSNFTFVGRLSAEKGVAVLLEAWALARPACELRIIGTGPEEMNLRAQAASLPSVKFLGRMEHARVLDEMGKAAAVVVPSIWYEPFGLTVIEAFSKGTPVVATDLGGLSSLIDEGRSGRLFSRGDAAALARLLSDTEGLHALRSGARQAYETRFTPEQNYREIVTIYSAAIESMIVGR